MSATRGSLRAFSRRFAVAVVLTASLMAGAVVAVNNEIAQKINAIPRIKVTTATSPPGGANFVLLGSDTRSFVKNATQRQAFGDATASTTGNSDTLMVIHVEPAAQRTLIVSFPRDLWVPIAGHGTAKINAAFGYGPQTVVDTFKQDFNIDINHYMEVDFESFREIVNAIGTVPIYFPYPVRDLKTGLHLFLGGCYPLDGTKSLEYARSRYLEYYNPLTKRWFSPDPIPDIGRIARQQEFIRTLAGVAVKESLSDPLTANAVADGVVKYLQVDQSLTKDDLFSLIDAFRAINPNDSSSLEFQTLPWHPGPNQGNLQVLYVDDAAAAPLLARLRDFSGTSAPHVAPSDVRVKVLNGSGRNGDAQAALQVLEKLGYKGAGAADNPSGRVANSEVRYAPGQENKGKLLLGYLNPSAKLVADANLHGADAAIVLGTDFQSIVKPAASAAGTAIRGPATPASDTVPTSTPNGAGTALQLPGAAPRIGC